MWYLNNFTRKKKKKPKVSGYRIVNLGHHIKAQKTVDFVAFQIWNFRLGMLDTNASACINKTYMYDNPMNKRSKRV